MALENDPKFFFKKNCLPVDRKEWGGTRERESVAAALLEAEGFVRHTYGAWPFRKKIAYSLFHKERDAGAVCFYWVDL